jgi:DNA-binding transcriptional MocR family regulator
MKPRFASRMTRVQPSAIRDLLRLGDDPGIISFGGGYPDASLFPAEQLSAIIQSSLAESKGASLQYTASNGLPRLRAQIAERMTRDGVPCGADDVLILQGGQQGLDLTAKMLIEPGDVIVTENPTFLGALIAFNPCEPRYAPVPMDQDGMDMNALERTLRENPGTKLLYTVPDFQNPTGVTLSLARRKRLIALANEFDLIVLEDTPYRELRYAGEAIPPIKSLDTEGRVIYLGSFSKILAPGLRLGWAVAAPDLLEKLGLLKVAADTQCGTLSMHAASAYLATHDIDAHIATIRATYRRKKDLMLDCIRRSFPQDIHFTDPEGGMFTWLTFPEGFDATAFMQDFALPEAKVAYVPGATFFPVREEMNHARVSYPGQTDDKIVEGMTRLGELLKRRA